MKNMNQQLGMRALDYILEMPDDLFRTTYPTLVEEFKKSAISNEFNGGIENGISEEERAQIIQDIDELEEQLSNNKEIQNLSTEKRSFLQLILDVSKDKIANIPYRDNIHVNIELCHNNAKVPTYANPTDAGCDVYAVEDITLEGKETKIVPTGFKLAIPIGWMISVRPRSGMSLKTPLRVANAPGTIDSFYRDEVGIIIHNTSSESITIHAGERIAQLVIEQAPMIKFDIVDDINLVKGNRGGGYGSSGT